MSNRKMVGSRVLLRILLVALFAFPGLSGCGGGAETESVTTSPDTTPPVVSSGQPSGTLPGGTNQVIMGVTTNEVASCKWGTSSGTSYAAMANTFTNTTGTMHHTLLTGLSDGVSYTRYVRCQDGVGNANMSSYAVSFSVNTGAGPITLSLNTSRLSGVAPLAVFFDATLTTHATPTIKPFHDLEYRWDFDDTGSGSWTSTPNMPNLSRNAATGPVAAHVFEAPGTYIVSLTVFDGTNTNITTVPITVDNPDTVFAAAKTICFSNTNNASSFVGCPAGAQQVPNSSNFATVMSLAATGKRLLLQRGGAWTGSGALKVDGPGTVGAYGSGARPIITVSGTDAAALQLSDSNSPTINDWRVMDLEINGSNAQTYGIRAVGGINQVTILRVNIHNTWFGLEFSHFVLDFLNGAGFPGHTLWDQLAIVDSNVDTIVNSGYGAFLSARRMSILGNTMSNSLLGQHILRIAHASKAVISHNALSNPANTKQSIKFHATAWQGGGVADPGASGHFSEQVVISDNKLMGGTSGNVWTVGLGPDNPNDDQRMRDFIVERNWFSSAGFAAQSAALVIWGVQDFTIRNNLFNLTGALTGHTGAAVFRRGVEPNPLRVSFLNNTFYSSDTGSDFLAISFDSTCQNNVARNNLAYAPNHSSPKVLSDAGSNTTKSNNSTDTQAKSTSPLFVSGLPLIPADFRPQTGSYARNTGAAVPVFSDLYRASRPQGSAIDLGASEIP